VDVNGGNQMRKAKIVRRVLLVGAVLGVAVFAFSGILRRPAASVVQGIKGMATDVGLQNITVILSPVDVRVRDLPPELPEDAAWAPELYGMVKPALFDTTSSTAGRQL
jgi:hypothetical protein